MACKWADSTFSKTPMDAGMSYESAGGVWYTSDIDHYLTDNNITHGFISLQSPEGTKQILKKQIDLSQVVILCIDMNYIRSCNNDNYHIDKFYATTPGFGHFFIVKGYAEVDNECISRYMTQTVWDKQMPMAL